MKLQKSVGEVLKKIKELGGKAKVKELEKFFDHAQIMRSLLFLENEKILEKVERVKKFYYLEEEGKKYLDKGLPERNLINSLRHGKKPIGELKIENLDIAIANCVKKGLVRILKESGKAFIEITEKGRKYLDRKMEEEVELMAVSKGEAKNLKILESLIKRKIVNFREEKEVLVEIIKDVDFAIEESVSELSPAIIKNWRDYKFREYDVEAPVEIIYPGKKHFYKNFLDNVKGKLLSLGFKEMKSPIIELEFWNFDALFQAQDHAAREIHDKFEIQGPEFGDIPNKWAKKVGEMHEKGFRDSIGWGYRWSPKKASKLMLRSQNTATSIRALATLKEVPLKVFTIDRVFRPDTIDKKHFIEFYQMEGIVKDKNLNFRHLLGYLKIFGEEIAEAEKLKFVPGYFPFTEPSVELMCYKKGIGWIEVGGAGIFRPEVLIPFDIRERVLAWGMGIDRLAMLKFGIDDIRDLVFPRDLNKLRQGILV